MCVGRGGGFACRPSRAASMSALRMSDTIALRASRSAANSQLSVSGLPAGGPEAPAGGLIMRSPLWFWGHLPGGQASRQAREGDGWALGDAVLPYSAHSVPGCPRTRAAAAAGTDVGQSVGGLLAHVEGRLLQQAHELLQRTVMRIGHLSWQGGRDDDAGGRGAAATGGTSPADGRAGVAGTSDGRKQLSAPPSHATSCWQQTPREQPAELPTITKAAPAAHRHCPRRLESLDPAPAGQAGDAAEHPAGLPLNTVMVDLLARDGVERGGLTTTPARQASALR